MSALSPKADMLIVGINVCYVPYADVPLRIVAAHGGLLGFELATELVR